MHKYTVTKVRDLTGTTILLSLKKLSKKPFSYNPGQYAAISFNVNGHQSPARCFSIASSPTKTDNYDEDQDAEEAEEQEEQEVERETDED